MHWPPRTDAALRETWRQMELLVRDGLVRAIGLSNCPAVRIQALLASTQPPLAVLPCVNQIEMHAGFRNDALRAFCASVGIHVTAHTALGGGALLTDPHVVSAASRVGMPDHIRFAVAPDEDGEFRTANVVFHEALIH